jgi:HPt (histidine-containing phosphotransfer) domain-containing protein
MNVDWERINSFIDEENEEERDWLKDMIGTLISNYEERLAELNEIIKKQDNEGLISLLHQMKGITANFGLEKLRQITLSAESLAKGNNHNASVLEAQNLFTTWEVTKAELKSKMGI